MSDQFRVSEDLADEAVFALPAEPPAVDPENPGFASLLTLARALRDGHGDASILAVYLESLGRHLAASRARLDAFPLTEATPPQIAAMLDGTRRLLDRMGEALQLLGAGEAHYAEAVAVLEALYAEVRASVGRPPA